MVCQVIHDPAHCWEQFRAGGAEVYCKGAFWSAGKHYAGSQACERLHALLMGLEEQQGPTRLDSIRHALTSLEGNFAFILQGKDYALACVDHIRSYPLFYSHINDGIALSWSAQALKAQASLDTPNETSVMEFLMAGYVSGPNTLYNGLQQLQGGEFLLYTKENREVSLERYCTFFSENTLEGSEEELLHEADIRHERAFAKMVQALDGRQACVLLSGGLDSRLILGFLKEHKYDNVVTATYGKQGLWEIKVAKAVAEKAGVPWSYVGSKPDAVKDHLYSKEGYDYFRFASGLASIPFVTENYAFSVLRSEKRLAEDCVILNGQTGDFITGGHLPRALLARDEEEAPTSALLDYVVERHYSLWRNLKTERNKSRLRDILSAHMGLDPWASLSKVNVAKQYERFEWQERQCKYVVNGQRLYDWLGYDWQLPLWDMELFTFWQEVPWRHKVGQALYNKYVQTRNPGGLFNIETPGGGNYIPAAFLAPQMLYQTLAKMLNLDRDWFKRKFINYFWIHSPYYPQRSYLEFLKDSGSHRNYLSYVARTMLEVLRAH
jgi:asparagine synthase (glutamine-hydrolysing)